MYIHQLSAAPPFQCATDAHILESGKQSVTGRSRQWGALAGAPPENLMYPTFLEGTFFWTRMKEREGEGVLLLSLPPRSKAVCLFA